MKNEKFGEAIALRKLQEEFDDWGFTFGENDNILTISTQHINGFRLGPVVFDKDHIPIEEMATALREKIIETTENDFKVEGDVDFDKTTIYEAWDNFKNAVFKAFKLEKFMDWLAKKLK